MALDTFAAGPYSATYNSVAIGLSEGGYTLSHEIHGEEIRGDLYGQSIIDAVIQGQTVRMRYTSIAYKAGSLLPFYPIATLGLMPTPGVLFSDAAYQLVLTVTAGTSAATAGPASLTASKAIVAPNTRAEMLLGSRHRKLPVDMVLLPYSSTGIRNYATT